MLKTLRRPNDDAIVIKDLDLLKAYNATKLIYTLIFHKVV